MGDNSHYLMPTYQIIHSKRKSIAIIIERDGRLVVRAPLRATKVQIEALLAEKGKWIQEKQELNRTLWKALAPKTFIDGEEFLFLGKSYRLVIVKNQNQALIFKDGFYFSRKAMKMAKAVFEKWYREQARRILTERVNLFAQKHGFNYKGIRITSARTRWGSCGSQGSLNFPWRLVMAPMSVIDYVVIHELVHLEEKNHSRKFWAKVESLMPGYKQRREWLKRNGDTLKLT